MSNMDEYHKCSSPRSSNVDSLIEKFRLEITKKSDEDQINIKKLTITASNKSQEPVEPSRDIDKKISDLESLIKKLQDELNDISSNKPSYEDCAEEIPILYNCEPEDIKVNDTLAQENTKAEQNTMCAKEMPTETTNVIFPSMLRDIDHVKEDEDEKVTEEEIFEEQETEEPAADKQVVLICDDKPVLICDDKPILLKDDKPFLLNDKEIILENSSELPETISDIGQTVLYSWKQGKKDTEEEEENMTASTDSIAAIIAELRAEIDETLHTLDKDAFGPTQND